MQSFYEQEASNSSDCLSHSDESHDEDNTPRQNGFMPKQNGFVPISEETVFLDSPPIDRSGACGTSLSHMGYSSSPMSVDSCMMYSDCSQYTESSEEASSDMDLSNHARWKPVTDDKWLEASRPRNIPRVDVRMIDFAHTTFGASCASNSLVHQGPDNGFITGLDSLRRLLTEILAEQ
jgi:inositol-hexakisphosphate kinase